MPLDKDTLDTPPPDTTIPEASMQGADVIGMKSNTYCMLIHLSQLLNYATAGVSFLGLVVPLVLWAIVKDKNTQVDLHGKIVMNWQISYLIYFWASVVLCAAFIGFLLVPIVWALGIIFPIIGAVKANNEGVAWKYPLSIKFFQ